ADTRDDPEDQSALEDAKRFLLAMLAEGPIPVKEINHEASDAGHSAATVRRAKKALGVEALKAGMTDPWVWALPVEGEQGR
ncbi:MAG TPA: hypothetical protein VES73_00225, partial [Lamprocystis sp. (in: g-proteobacteria)]|nr:hypothetical protein [Lamprocystis sp. (in: g-proteobacteria)]